MLDNTHFFLCCKIKGVPDNLQDLFSLVSGDFLLELVSACEKEQLVSERSSPMKGSAVLQTP